MNYDTTQSLKNVMLNYVESVMIEHGGNKEKVRKHLGIARSTLYRYLDQIKLRRKLAL